MRHVKAKVLIEHALLIILVNNTTIVRAECASI